MMHNQDFQSAVSRAGKTIKRGGVLCPYKIRALITISALTDGMDKAHV